LVEGTLSKDSRCRSQLVGNNAFHTVTDLLACVKPSSLLLTNPELYVTGCAVFHYLGLVLPLASMKYSRWAHLPPGQISWLTMHTHAMTCSLSI
jgi:hypothetical protein